MKQDAGNDKLVAQSVYSNAISAMLHAAFQVVLFMHCGWD